jgi:transcriptional regulator PpsR
MEASVFSKGLLNEARSGERPGGIDLGAIANLVAATSDIAFVMDEAGVIADLSVGDHLDEDELDGCIGRRWVDLVANESKIKVEQLLSDAIGGKKPRLREINHRLSDGAELPAQFSVVHVGPVGRILALGRDLRPIAKLQQRVIDLQRSSEREYARVRNAETRYRMLFQLSSEALVVIEAGGTKVTEANPAAAALFGRPAAKVTGAVLRDLFDASSDAALQELIQTARVAGRSENTRLLLADQRTELRVGASSFRNDNTLHILIKLSSTDDHAESAPKLPVLEILKKIPEAFVVIDQDRRILEANDSFIELAELASTEQARGQRLDRWLGRPGVDVDLIVSNLREHGSLRDFSTILRSEHLGQEEVEVTGVAAMHGSAHCYGMTIRVIRHRAALSLPRGAANFPSAITNLAELVGRVSLKELVRETTDMVEQMCIEAALELTNDNRASAAQILGLSRQGLYAKLRRYGIDDAVADDETGQDSAERGLTTPRHKESDN